MRYILALGMACCAAHGLLTVAWGKPIEPVIDAVTEHAHVDRVGDVDGADRSVSKAGVDTIWIADWTFDGAGGACDDSGWEKFDNRVYNDGEVYWSIDSDFAGTGSIQGRAARLGYRGNACCVNADGYDNDWYQAIRLTYKGSGSLSFDYLVDSEEGYDFLRVELDSACASHDRVDYSIDALQTAQDLRKLVFAQDGNVAGQVNDLPVTDFGTPQTHCLYIAFFSDEAWSPCDGLQPTNIGAGLVVDNVELTGVGSPVDEDFEDVLGANVSFANIRDTKPFGGWARVFEHATDNDVCTENTTCSWLFTDDTTPSIAIEATHAYGPDAMVVRNWLDEIIVSPWVSIPSPGQGTIVSWRQGGGTGFETSRIVWSGGVRGKILVDDPTTPTSGDSLFCTSKWRPGGIGNLTYGWRTHTRNVTRWVPADARAVQVRFRILDAQLFGYPPPSPFLPGPGPYIDRVRIGRIPISGPAMIQPGFGLGHGTGFSQLAQDAFPTEIDPFVDPSAGEHHRPTTDRFGTAAFSMSADIARGGNPRTITGDSIVVVVEDQRHTGGIASVDWYGAIVRGPHAGKAPPPWTVGANGFFKVPADSVKDTNGVVQADRWFVDLDDDYFRGGDVLVYFWLGTDLLGGMSSSPDGLSGLPSSIEEAEQATRGLWAVNFLPTIDWDPGYLARIASDPHGKLEPSVEELANSSQASCILYNDAWAEQRRSGGRTAFMYTLDALGYRGHYDVYQNRGFGAPNNPLATRATIEQATGYAMIIHDIGLHSGGTSGGLDKLFLPDGTGGVGNKIDQATWYRNWLSNAATSEAGTSALWLIGSELARLVDGNPLLADMGTNLTSTDVLEAIGQNPDVVGQTSFTFANGNNVSFESDEFTMASGCPSFWPFNGLDASGSAVVTHRWKESQSNRLVDGAVVMNANPAQSWSSVFMSVFWDEIVDGAAGPSYPPPENRLMAKILSGVLPADCLRDPNPTDVRDRDDDALDALPKVTALYQNAPNPFNPTTTIRFDLAHEGHVALSVYDVSGRLVRTLVNGPVERKRHEVVWDGMDNAGVPVSSGIYFYRLETVGFRATHKMVVLR